MFSCERAARLMSDGLERPLSFYEKCSMHVHMAICATCRRYKRQIEFIDRILKKQFRQVKVEITGGVVRVRTPLDLTPEAKERMRKVVASG